jgi:hypothetical protein
MLLTDRRRLFGRREEDDERDSDQGSLFAPPAAAPPAARSPGATPDPFASPPPPRSTEAAAPAAELAARPPVEILDAGFAPSYDDIEADVPADDLEELEPVHVRAAASRSVLAGPTLDDVMSRVWEGLRAEVPTPCPVCHAEIEPSAHGHCAACGSTLR